MRRSTPPAPARRKSFGQLDAPDLTAAIVWFDAFVTNVDRTARHTNLLMWHRRLWLIDHGAALYFHHALGGRLHRAQLNAFPDDQGSCIAAVSRQAVGS
jgi:hypothetical protein